MNYVNAKAILPAILLAEVQKYAEGKVIFIPKSEKRTGEGETSGYRQSLMKRDDVICSRYSSGQAINEIAEEFFLSPEMVKKLVHGSRISLPEYAPSFFSDAVFRDGPW